MTERQNTLKSPVSVSGIGLHTGKNVNLTLLPANEDHGFVFQRTDIDGKPSINADANLVVDTSRGTTLGLNGTRVHTVEHVLAALVGLKIDNALIQLDAPEPPALDGSSWGYVNAIQQGGIQAQNKEAKVFRLDEPIVYEEKERGVKIELKPSKKYSGEVIIDFSLDFFPRQNAVLEDISQFPLSFAKARTFCFLHEVEFLIKAGLIKGGNLDSAVVMVDRKLGEDEMDRLLKMFGKPILEIQEGGILNEGGFRYPNEPAKHKLLDLLGDLALAGARIEAEFKALRPGHKANVELAKLVKQHFV